MVRVELVQSGFYYGGRAWTRGAVLDLPDATAAAWIDAGLAKEYVPAPTGPLPVKVDNVPVTVGAPPGGLLVSLGTGAAAMAPTFEEWATRNGYMGEHFSGELAVPTATESTLIDLTVPAGQTWYRRRTWYSVEGARTGRFKLYRTLPGQAETYHNLVVVRNNDSAERKTYGKYPAGSRIRIATKPDPLAAAGDLVTARVQFVKVPWAE